MAVTAIAGTIGIIALFEGLAALLEHIEGDPEADVRAALQQLASKNQRRAFGLTAGEQLGQEHIEAKFAKFNKIPSRLLTQAALNRDPRPLVGEPNSAVLDMVSARLGITGQQMGELSHPSRLGDMSSIARKVGKTPFGSEKE